MKYKYSLHEYKDYDEYVRLQREENEKKRGWINVTSENIEAMSDYIVATSGQPHFGLCHGTRYGREQQYFKKYLNCKVLGTDICEKAGDSPNTIKWDFHNVKPEWIDNVDFIYSNSWDHSYAPEKCLNAWMKCVKIGHLCILEYTWMHQPESTSPSDPFGVDLELFPYLILMWGKGRYAITDIVLAPTGDDDKKRYFLMIKRFK